MIEAANTLRFIWWNVQDFAHFDISRVHEKRWPKSKEEYAEKAERVQTVLRMLSREDLPHLVALGEITHEAAGELRDALFPTFAVHTFSSLYLESGFRIAVLYDRSVGFGNEDFTVASNLPNSTRPMVVLDYRSNSHAIRFYFCHWTGRLDKSSKKWRRETAAHLNREIYTFLHPEALVKESRHAVVLGDLNEEPYGMLETWLYASRNRAPSRAREHYTDKGIRRIKLYNCAWRLLGEHYPHPQPLRERNSGQLLLERRENLAHFRSSHRKRVALRCVSSLSR